MKAKFAIVVAASAALLVGQAAAQQPAVPAPLKAAAAAKKAPSPLRRAAAPMGRANSQVETLNLELLAFFVTGTAIALVVYEVAEDSNDPKSP